MENFLKKKKKQRKRIANCRSTALYSSSPRNRSTSSSVCKAGALVPSPPCRGEGPHRWVPVDTHSTPVLTSVRRLWLAYVVYEPNEPQQHAQLAHGSGARVQHHDPGASQTTAQWSHWHRSWLLQNRYRVSQPLSSRAGHHQKRGKSGKIQILRRDGSSGRQMTKIQLILRNMCNVLPLTGWFNSQDKYSAVNDSVRGSQGVFGPHCASMAHRPRAHARVDRRWTFGNSDFVQMTFCGASKQHRFFCPKNRCFYPVWVLRVTCFLCVCPCVCVSLCVTPVSIQNASV